MVGRRERGREWSVQKISPYSNNDADAGSGDRRSENDNPYE